MRRTRQITSIERTADYCVWRVHGVIGERVYYYTTKAGARFKYGHECDTGGPSHIALEIELKQDYERERGSPIFVTPRQTGKQVPAGLPPVIGQVA